MKYLCCIVAAAFLVTNTACDSRSSSPPSPMSTVKSAPSAAAQAAEPEEAVDPPAEPGEQQSPTDETSPTTEAHASFPNEESALISPEGQRVLDDIDAGRIPQPPIQGDFESFDAKDDVEEVEGEEGPEAKAACSGGTMKKVYKATMSKFLKYRKDRYCKSNYKWSTDGCSKVPDTGLAFDFRYSCYRHDFGYRNYKKFGIFTKGNKKTIDNKFLSDMKAHCSKRSIFLKPDCYKMAYAYYWGVRKLGD